MKKNDLSNATKVLAILFALVLAGFGANAFGQGYGSGCPYFGKPGQNQGTGAYACPAYAGNLSEEQIKKLDEERQAFYDAAKETEQKLYEKELALKSEFAKAESDAEKAKSLQKDISELQAQLDQQRVEHFVRVKKINPDFGARPGAWCKKGRGAYLGCGGRGAGGGKGFGGCPRMR